MKIKNFTIYFFAIIGFVVIACSAAATADDNPDDNPPPVFSNIGKYQIVIGADESKMLFALNTETGVCKTYNWDRPSNRFLEITTATITFTH